MNLPPAVQALAWLLCAAPRVVADGDPAAEPTVNLTVVIKGFRGTHGQGLVDVFGDKKSFPHGDKALRRARAPIAGDSCIVLIEGLAPGQYAIAGTHDEDGDGMMDRNWIGIPTEAGAFSNGYVPAGPPSWDKARITLAAGAQRVVMTLTYMK